LAQAIYKEIQPEKISQTKWLLDLVAIGTIADCVSLLGENRILVKYGLVVLSKTKRVGLQEMFKVGRMTISEKEVPNVHKVAFQISPRINAAGRMDHANVAFNLLIEKESAVARIMALEIEGKNQERQKVTAEITREIKIIAENSFKEKRFIFAENAHWPVGLLGLVAGKITDEFNKPTMILQKQGEELAGSLRSIPQVNIIETLEKCSVFLERFGGHSQAAGVRVKKINLEKFCAKMSKLIEDELKGKEIDLTQEADLEISLHDVGWGLLQDLQKMEPFGEGRVKNVNLEKFCAEMSELIEKELEGKEMNLAQEADMEIGAENIGWELMLELKKMEPFGEGNNEPIFIIKNLIVEDVKIVGNGNKHLKMFLRAEEGSPKMFDAIFFGGGNDFGEIKKGDKIDIACNLCQDEWNGNKKIQLKIIDLKIS
jgi:single-stranded DNA-specific DHH superfamily exonuclease